MTLLATRLDSDVERLVTAAMATAALVGPDRPAPRLALRVVARLTTEFEIGLEVRPSAVVYGRPSVSSATSIPAGDAQAVRDAVAWFRARRAQPDRAAHWEGASVDYTPLWKRTVALYDVLRAPTTLESRWLPLLSITARRAF